MKLWISIKKHYEIWTIGLLSLVTHLFWFGFPKEAVFDEVYFTSFVSGYFTHQFFFDIHPPLGKLLIAAVAYITDFTPITHQLVIGEAYIGDSFLWLRLLPVIAGILLPIVIYFLCKELKLSKMAAFVAGLLIVFESSLLVQSRFTLLDSSLLLFGFFGLLLYFIYRRTGNLWIKFVSVIFLTFAFSIKWTGGTFIALVVVIETIHYFRDIFLQHKNKLLSLFRFVVENIFLFFLIPFIIYYSIFVLHFKLLNQSGPGDAFMSKNFQKTLIGNTVTPTIEGYEVIDLYPVSNTAEKFIELNIEMYLSNKRLDAEHDYGSVWYSWPFMARPIYYWQGSTDNGTNRHIYLFGNPFIYVASFVSIVTLLLFTVLSFSSQFKKLLPRFNKKTALLLLFAYLLNLLPFIGIPRVMFLYHYFVALIFAIISLVFIIDCFNDNETKKQKFILLIVISVLIFLYFSPLIYGMAIPKWVEPYLFLFSSWR